MPKVKPISLMPKGRRNILKLRDHKQGLLDLHIIRCSHLIQRLYMHALYNDRLQGFHWVTIGVYLCESSMHLV